MLLDYITQIVSAIIVLGALAFVVIERIIWKGIIVELISRALPMDEEHIRIQIARLLAANERAKEIEKAERRRERLLKKKPKTVEEKAAEIIEKKERTTDDKPTRKF